MLPKSVKTLITELSRLPGIGPKSAQRLAIHLLHLPPNRISTFGESILKLKENVIYCANCWHISETSPCPICSDKERDHGVVCVVEEFLDVVAIEKTRDFKGLYHVLHGVLSPVDGIGPEQLKLMDLFARVKNSLKQDSTPIKEIILATNPSIEGETTALYIQKNLADLGVKITRIARGLPMGGDLDYADEVTLSKAMKGRMEF